MIISKKELRASVEAAIEQGGIAGVRAWLDEICADERVKLDENARKDIAREYALGRSIAEIADRNAISAVHVRRVLGIVGGKLELDPGIRLKVK